MLAARVTGGERSRNPFNMVDTLELDPASVIVLTDRVTNGVLHWDAPEGEWHIVASYPHIRILLTSGYAEDILSRHSDEEGIGHRILRNPYRQSDLATALSVLFDKESARH